MTNQELSADEIALYDRQIRLWGMATQLRLRSAKILLINVGGIGTEIVKNLVLGGLNSIELLDDSVVKEEDFACQFFLPNDESVVGQLKLPIIVDAITELNNRVNITTNTESLALVLQLEQYFAQFDLIIATELSKENILKLNQVTRAINVPLYVTGLHGMFGYLITDLISHESTSEKDAGNQLRQPGTQINARKLITKVDYNADTNKETITIRDDFSPIEDIFTSKKLPTQLNKRQMKRLSAALPLIFALFEIDRPVDVEASIDQELLKQKALEVAETFNIPPQVITDEYINSFSRQAFTEFSPIAAILGGTVAQDIIQFLSKKESPINNVLILDGKKSEMPIYLL